jgi:hypothetical protein
MNRRIYLLSLLFICALNHCESPRVADNSSSETTNGAVISGIVRDSSGLKVTDARVWLSRRDSAKIFLFTSADCTYTNETGMFQFGSVVPGTYFVSARKGNQTSTSVSLSVTGGDKIEMPPDTVRNECTVSAVIDAGSDFPFALRLHDTPLLATPDETGRVRLHGVAAGVYRFEALALDLDNGPWAAIIERGRIELTPGDSIHLGQLAPRPFAGGADSVVLDDFEDGDGRHVNGHGWWGYDDGKQLDTSFDDNFAYLLPDSTRCAFLRYTFGHRQPTFCGIGVHLGYRRGEHINRSYDFSNLKAVSFRAKGTPHPVRIEFISHIDTKLTAPVDTLRPDWKRYRIDIDSTIATLDADKRDAWGRTGRFVSWFTFFLRQGDGPIDGEFFVDDILFEFEN